MNNRYIFMADTYVIKGLAYLYSNLILYLFAIWDEYKFAG